MERMLATPADAEIILRLYELRTEATDALQFEHLVAAGRSSHDPLEARSSFEAALKLWRGEAYAEFAHEPWCITESWRLAEARAGAIEDLVGLEIPVVRAMPNTPSALGAGAAALCRGRFVTPEKMELAQRLFETVGRAVVVDEKHMDAVTGLSGSGPAYIYIIIEALAEAGVKVGLPRDIATQLAAQTAFGAAKMVLETGYHPALLKDAVTTPAGCTIDGILELEEGGLRVTLIKAVMRATERAKQLAAG